LYIEEIYEIKRFAKFPGKDVKEEEISGHEINKKIM
jgi:hypothetical protein